MIVLAGDADDVLQLRQAVVSELQAHPQVRLNIGWGLGGVSDRSEQHELQVHRCDCGAAGT